MNARFCSYRILAGLVIWGLALTTAGLSGCAGPGLIGDTVQADVIQSERARRPAPALEEARVPELVAGNTAFALDLLDHPFLFLGHVVDPTAQ